MVIVIFKDNLVTTKQISQPRGRPRGFDTERAIQTALHLFHQKGYDAVGVAELGQALGIKPPSFYAAFGSKAGLFKRVLDHYVAGEANVFGVALAEGGGVDNVIERMFLNAAKLYPAKQGSAGCLVLDGTRNSADPEAQRLTAAARQGSHDALSAYIATEYPDRAQALTDFAQTALLGMSAAARDGMDEDGLTRFAQIAARTFLREASVWNVA